MTFGEVGAEAFEIIPFRSQVIVDHIEDYRETLSVACVNQPLQSIRPAVGFMRGEEVHSVIPPAPGSGKGVDGHKLHMGDSQVREVVQPVQHSVERPLRAERPHLQFIDDGRSQRRRLPACIGPGEPCMIQDAGGTVNARGLPWGARVGEGRVPVQNEGVVRAVFGERSVPRSTSRTGLVPFRGGFPLSELRRGEQRGPRLSEFPRGFTPLPERPRENGPGYPGPLLSRPLVASSRQMIAPETRGNLHPCVSPIAVQGEKEPGR